MPPPSAALPKLRLSRGSYLEARKNPRCVEKPQGCSAPTFTHRFGVFHMQMAEKFRSGGGGKKRNNRLCFDQPREALLAAQQEAFAADQKQHRS